MWKYPISHQNIAAQILMNSKANRNNLIRMWMRKKHNQTMTDATEKKKSSKYDMVYDGD